MSRLSGYPLTSVSVDLGGVDGHGDPVAGTTEVWKVLWQDEVRNMVMNNQSFLIQSWMVTDKTPSQTMVVTKGGRKYTVAGWAEFNQRGMLHYQVFLS